MSAVVWIWLHQLLRIVLTWESRLRARSPRKRKTVPGIESLEAMALLSSGAHMMGRAAEHLDLAREHRLVRRVTIAPRVDGLGERAVTHRHVSSTDAMDPDQAPVTSPVQTVSLGSTTTNFTNEPLSPVLSLFNPSQGTLLSVTVTHSATIQGNITSQNLSPNSETVITATFTGSFQINGLNQPISQPTKALVSQPTPAGPFGSGTDTVIFPTFVLPDSSTTTFTDPASLAFFTSTSGNSATTVTMSATATASASAPDGNLLTTSTSSGSASVSVTYTYMPVCPTVSGIGRIGVHHQPTELVVTFDGPVDPAKAVDTNDYHVILPGGKTVPIKSATFDPATNAVTVIPAIKLNVHHHFRLSVVLPCPNEPTGETVIVPFGGKRSLIGFHNHKGEFVTVKNGRITGFDNHNGQFIPVHDRKIESRPQVTINRRSHGKSDHSAPDFSRKPGFISRRTSSEAERLRLSHRT